MDWAKAEPLAAPIRFAAFFEDSRPGIELDADDAKAVHAIAFDEAGKAVGTGRLLPDGRIGAFAAPKEWHRLGVDAGLLDALLAGTRKRSYFVLTGTAPRRAAVRGEARRGSFSVVGFGAPRQGGGMSRGGGFAGGESSSGGRAPGSGGCESRWRFKKRKKMTAITQPEIDQQVFDLYDEYCH